MTRFLSLLSLCLSITSLIYTCKTYDIDIPSPLEIVKDMTGTTSYIYYVERTDHGTTVRVEPHWEFGF